MKINKKQTTAALRALAPDSEPFGVLGLNRVFIQNDVLRAEVFADFCLKPRRTAPFWHRVKPPWKVQFRENLQVDELQAAPVRNIDDETYNLSNLVRAAEILGEQTIVWLAPNFFFVGPFVVQLKNTKP
jgi:hypothetical protein